MLKCQAQRVLSNGTKSSWKPNTNGVYQRLILGPIVLNIFINGVDNGTECTLNNFADSTNLGGMAVTPDCCAAIRRTLTV